MKLIAFLNLNDISMTQFAENLGTTTATISRIADGQVVPRRDLILRIYEETGGQVTPNDLLDLPGKEM